MVVVTFVHRRYPYIQSMPYVVRDWRTFFNMVVWTPYEDKVWTWHIRQAVECGGLNGCQVG
jgi:hypothetical protein